MNILKKWLFPGLFLTILASTVGAVYFVQDSPLRQQADERMADLRQAKSQYDGVLADLTTAQRTLLFSNGTVLTTEEIKTLKARIEKDQANLEPLTVQILGDLSFLERNEGILTPAEGDYLRLVRQSLTGMTGQSPTGTSGGILKNVK